MTEQMKPSGIACVGDIPQDWDVKRLKYACQQITDGSHFSPDTVDDGKVYITVTDLYDDTIHTDTAKRIAPSDFVALVRNGCQPKKGDVLLSKDGTVGRSAIVDSNNDYVVLSSIGILTPRNSMLSRYLKYNLDGIHMQEQMLRAMDGSALKRITISKIAEFFAVIPPINDQKAIADFLDVQCAKIDSIIADIEKQIETLQKYKKSLITETVTKGLDKSMPMKYSGIEWIGNIPEHWQVKKLSYECERIGDIDHYMPDSVDEGIPYVMTGDLIGDGNEIDFKNCKQISEQDYQRLSRKMKPILNDIIFARYATIGTVRIVDFDREFLVSYSCAIIRPKKNLHSKYLFYYLKSNAFFEEISKYINTNTQGNVGIDSLGRAKTPIPRLEEQIEISKFLDKKCADIEDVIAAKEKQLDAIKQHKKSLIYEYVTGKKRVTEVN